MTPPTTFHLVRHAAHGLLGHVLAGRMPGVCLSDEGLAQAAGLAASLQSHPIAAIIASPLERAQQTASAIADRLGLKVITDDRLTEIDFGEWTGLGFDDLHSHPAWRAWNSLRSVAAVPGGETMLAAQARALSVIVQLRQSYPGAELVLVSHSDVLKSVLAHALGVPLDLMQRIELAPASRSVLRLFDEDARVEGINLST